MSIVFFIFASENSATVVIHLKGLVSRCLSPVSHIFDAGTCWRLRGIDLSQLEFQCVTCNSQVSWSHSDGLWILRSKKAYLRMPILIPRTIEAQVFAANWNRVRIVLLLIIEIKNRCPSLPSTAEDLLHCLHKQPVQEQQIDLRGWILYGYH